MNAQQMLSTHPNPFDLDLGVLAECIEACFDCAQACTTCADACLGGDAVEAMRYCIRTDLDCADVCTATARVLSRQTTPSRDLILAQVGACLKACQVSGEECRSHADQHAHCKRCGEACQRCEDACSALLNALEHTEMAH